jgi:hypothetical protein
MAGWLRGFFDGEGSAYFGQLRAGKRHPGYGLTISNTDDALIDTCAEYLKALGVAHTEATPRPATERRKKIRCLLIKRGAAVKAFAAIVGFTAPSKQRRLEMTVAWIDRPGGTLWANRRPQVLALWKEGHSLRCIVRRLGLADGSHNELARALLAERRIGARGAGRRRCNCLRQQHSE